MIGTALLMSDTRRVQKKGRWKTLLLYKSGEILLHQNKGRRGSCELASSGKDFIYFVCDVNLWFCFCFFFSLPLQTTDKAAASAGRLVFCKTGREFFCFYPNPVHLGVKKKNMHVSCDSSDSALELQVIAQAHVTNAARVTFVNSTIDDGDNRCESRPVPGKSADRKTAADRLNSEPIPSNPSSWCVSCRPLSARPHPQSKPQPRLIKDNPRGSDGRTDGGNITSTSSRNAGL